MNRIISLTDAGLELAQQLKAPLAAEICHRPQDFKQQVQEFFSQGDRLLFICATGIVVRTLAPVLTDKYNDPAVLVLDELGNFVIPLLSGHQGGANQWAQQVANILQAKAVITSAETYIEPCYVVGMGTVRNCSVDKLHTLLEQCLRQAGLNINQISVIASIDIKADEQGLINLAEKINKPFKTWSAISLRQVETLLSSRSDYLYKTAGVYGVAESAALYAVMQQTGEQGKLLLNKQKNSEATCAIACGYFKSAV